MKEVIAEVIPDFNLKSLKTLTWHDEIKDVFLLTKRMEIYFWSRYILGCYCWSYKTYVLLRRNGLILEEQPFIMSVRFTLDEIDKKSAKLEVK